MHLILHYPERYRTHVFFSILATLGFVTAKLDILIIVSRMIDNGIVLNDRAYTYKTGAAILAVAITGGIGNVLLAHCNSQVSTRITRGICNDIFRKAQGFSHAEYNKPGISSMITRTTNDAFILIQSTSIILRVALLTPIMIIISMFIVIRASVTLSMAVGGRVPIICLGVYLVVRASDPINTRQQKGLDRLNRITGENLTGIRMIRVFCKDEYETEHFSNTSEDCARNARKLSKLVSVTQPPFFLLLSLTISIVSILSSRLIDMDSLQVGNLVALQEYMFHVMSSMILPSLVFIIYPRTEISIRRIKELLDEQPLIQNPKNPVFSGNENSTSVFDHVSFQYLDGETPVLRDITFEVGCGDTVVFIGSTGSGKSMLINLIPRFYDISPESIRIDNMDVRKYDLKALREEIGFTPQKILLFTGSIMGNIRYSKYDAARSGVEHFAKVAQVYDFIMEKPHQLNKMIEEDGSNMSNDQCQRLSIAGIVVRKPSIYISDDSFSTLDFETDANLREKLKKETKGAITLTVAQRVTSTMDATKTIVLSEGVVAGMGAHRELLRNCSTYHGIATSRLSEEELTQ